MHLNLALGEKFSVTEREAAVGQEGSAQEVDGERGLGWERPMGM